MEESESKECETEVNEEEKRKSGSFEAAEKRIEASSQVE